MSARAGDGIEIESTSVGTATRAGEILEVIQGEISVRYRVRWQDGHESVLSPSGGSARIIPRRKTTPKATATTQRKASTKRTTKK